jgi:hypothetical protein
MPTSDKTGKAIRCWLNRRIRASVIAMMPALAADLTEARVDLRRENSQRILMRTRFRMGDFFCYAGAGRVHHRLFRGALAPRIA